MPASLEAQKSMRDSIRVEVVSGDRPARVDDDGPRALIEVEPSPSYLKGRDSSRRAAEETDIHP